MLIDIIKALADIGVELVIRSDEAGNWLVIKAHDHSGDFTYSNTLDLAIKHFIVKTISEA